MIWDTLLEFLIRLALGLSLGMLLTPPAQVSPGFFRVHLWVLLGMYTLAALFTTNSELGDPGRRALLICCIVGAVVCYIGGVIWLYDRPRTGRVTLLLVVIIGLVALIQTTLSASNPESSPSAHPFAWRLMDGLSASLLLGSTITAMLLGHWYLNSPGMELGPLRRLIILVAVSVVSRAVISASGLACLMQGDQQASFGFYAVLALRWLAGIFGVGILAAMTWATLRIPNTQSATGILYVAVIFSFLGELAARLAAGGAPYPL